MAPRGGGRTRLFVAVRRSHRWAALLDDDRLVEFHVEHEGQEGRAGDVYLGRVIRVDHGLGAAFVDIGGNRAAFLPLSELAAAPVEGAAAVVQIEREGQGEKGPKVTARPTFPGVRLVLLPGRRAISLSERITDKSERSRLSALARAIAEPGEGLTVRTSAIGGKEDELRDEAAALRAVWRKLMDLRQSRRPPTILWRQLPLDLRLLRDHGLSFEGVYYDHRGAAEAAMSWCQTAVPDLAGRIIFRSTGDWQPTPAEILERVEDAVQPRSALPFGGSILIERTEAATIIDVNCESAAATHVDDDSERMFLRINLEAAREVARQIRLRNVGGIILIDFVDLKDVAARRQVVDGLRAAVALDSVPVWVGAMSRLGFVELTRRRRGPTLIDMLTQPCSACGGTGRIMRDDAWIRAIDTT